MARPRKKSDSVYNARRRFVREAERLISKSENAIGAQKQRYQALAREAIKNAAELYQARNARKSSIFERISNQLGINVNEFMLGDAPKQRERFSNLIRTSLDTLSTSKSIREREAQAILNSPIGSRIYGGLVDIWAKPTRGENGELIYKKGKAEINRAITDYFGVDSMMDVIEILEKQLPDLYADPENIEKYDAVTLAISRGLFE